MSFSSVGQYYIDISNMFHTVKSWRTFEKCYIPNIMTLIGLPQTRRLHKTNNLIQLIEINIIFLLNYLFLIQQNVEFNVTI